MRYVPDNNLSYPILITLEDGSKGSGFYLNYQDKDLYIVTARHILYDNMKKKITDPDNYVLKSRNINVLSYPADLKIITPNIFEIDLNIHPQSDILFSNQHDVAIIKIGTLTQNPESSTNSLTLSSAFKTIQSSTAPLVTVMDSYFKKFEDVLI